jgi:hypothetical protein
MQANDRRDIAASGPEGAAVYGANAATLTRLRTSARTGNSLPNANLPVQRLDRPPGYGNFLAARPERPDRVHGRRGSPTRPTLQEIVMKRLAFVAAVLAVTVTACSKSDEAAKDTATPAMAPAPAPAAATADTGMKMMDTAAKKMDTAMAKMDTGSKKATKKKKP